MVESKTAPGVSLGADCPECGGSLSPPASGSVHCYRKCGTCGEEFQLDDPRLSK